MFLSLLASDTSLPPLHSLRSMILHELAPGRQDFRAALWACPALEKLWIETETIYDLAVSHTEVLPIPTGAVPSLTFICAPWRYLRIFLRHPSVRQVWTGEIPHDECLVYLQEIYGRKPQLTAISFTVVDALSDPSVVEFVLTRFRFLEELSVSSYNVTEQVYNRTLELLLTADLAPKLRKVSVKSYEPEVTAQKASIELSSRLRQKCPLLAYVFVKGMENVLEWTSGAT
ncbi:hypothetical protein EUX98_g2934 [Antrodiella citrinella]|uniref:F-box domain-containing protein n=1 Tax=Antrodiella citrinella TaxID=2447956 RepID=A0A4S4MZ75_9APHY|nr:hypothetical protein EUX98_g2934 [Antrodiella citrinella]